MPSVSLQNEPKIHPYKRFFLESQMNSPAFHNASSQGNINMNPSSESINSSVPSNISKNKSNLGLGLSFNETKNSNNNHGNSTSDEVFIKQEEGNQVSHISDNDKFNNNNDTRSNINDNIANFEKSLAETTNDINSIHDNDKDVPEYRTARSIISLNSLQSESTPTKMNNNNKTKSEAQGVLSDFAPVPKKPITMTHSRGSPSSSSIQGSILYNKRSKSVDLSHLYLMNSSHDTQLTSTNESVADMSHQLISQYLGEENNSSLVPRLKTIEMYKENVKKSKDPIILFEYAQYMLQTALTMDVSNRKTDDKEKELKRQFLKEARHYLKKLSVKGYADAQYLLADAYSSGAFGKVDNKESFRLFQAAAKHGHIESAYRTAHCYEEGIGTTRDSRKALNFLKFAATRNHPSAMYKLGLYSFYGRMGLSDDISTKQNGIKWLSRATARANELTCAAPYELAKIYEVGFLDIVIPDEKYAMELYIEAATLGHIPSSTLLGQIYETGNSTVSQDVSLSVHYYTRAATRGDPVAMLGLCAWYLLGAKPAFQKDENEAYQWAYKAASVGYPKAQFTLGFFFEHGKGCEVNMESAWKWYERAAKNKDQRAINKMQSKSGTSFKKGRSKINAKKTLSMTTLNLFSQTDLDHVTDESEPKIPTNRNVEMEPTNIRSETNIANQTGSVSNVSYVSNSQSRSINTRDNNITNNGNQNDLAAGNRSADAKNINLKQPSKSPSNTSNTPNTNASKTFRFTTSEPPTFVNKQDSGNRATTKQEETKTKKRKDKKSKKDCIIM